MTDLATTLIEDALTAAQRHVTNRDAVAVITLGPDPILTLSEFSYWGSPQRRIDWETAAGKRFRERGARCAVLTVPMLVSEDEVGIQFNAPGRRPEPGEEEWLWCLLLSLDEGLELYRVVIGRRPDSTPVFGEPQQYFGDIQMQPDAPGFALLQALFQED